MRLVDAFSTFKSDGTDLGVKWGEFVRKSSRGIRECVQENSKDWLEQLKIEAAARASISQDPDQHTKVYPGYLRDSAFVALHLGVQKLEGEVGFSAEYAMAHHEEIKDYRYGEAFYLKNALGAASIDEYIRKF